MKYPIIIFLALSFCLSFSSCLKDVNSAFNPGPTPAVTQQMTALIVADTPYGVIFDEDLSTNAPGKCLIVDFTYNGSDADAMNVTENGYYVVNLQRQTAVNQANLKEQLTDINKLLTNEQPVKHPIIQNDNFGFSYAYLDQFLFLSSGYITSMNQKVNWELSYDPNEEPIALGDQPKVYPLYLRAYATTGRTETARDTTLYTANAFNITSFIENVKTKQGWDDRQGLYVTIRCVNQINPEDSTQFTLAQTEPLQINN